MTHLNRIGVVVLAAPRIRRPRTTDTRQLLATPEGWVLATGAVRVAIGALVLAAPVVSARALGMDSATAKRVSYLARMAAARDVGLGAGALSARSSDVAVPWVLAGAGADAVDAVALAAALKRGTARGPLPAVVALTAAASAVGGVWTARRLRG